MLSISLELRRQIMNTEQYVKLIFSKMVCSCCDNQFTPESIEIIRIEENCAIVKIQCSTCNKNYGIAMVGIEKIEIAPSEDIDNVLVPDMPPISLDDVIDAHKFFDSLSDDWMKYIPEEFKR